MALLQFTVTLAGTTTPVQGTTTRTPFYAIRVENDIGNAIAYYGTKDVTATSYAGTILPNTTTVTNVMQIDGIPAIVSSLDEFWFLGTDSQKLRVTLIS